MQSSLQKVKNEKCPNTDFLLVPIFSYSDWVRRFIELISVFIQITENTDQKNHRYEKFWCSGAQCMLSVAYEWTSKQNIWNEKQNIFKQILTCNWIFQKIITEELLVCYWKSFLLKKSLYFCSIIYLTLFSKSKTNFFYCEYSYSSIEGRGYLHRHLSFTIYHLSFIIYHRCFCDKERFILLLLSDSQKIQIERDKKWRW